LGATAYMHIYSDDITRMLEYSNTTGGNIYLRRVNFGPIANMYGGTTGTTQQTISYATMWSSVASGKGALTYQGYHYFMMSSTSPSVVNIWRATSTDSNDISVKANWATTTQAGPAITNINVTYPFLVGATNNQIWIASSSTQLVPFTISTSTNTLTAGTAVNIPAASMSSQNVTRVNDNGIYAEFSSAPFIRKFNLSGATSTPKMNMYSVIPVAGIGEVFATKNSFYANNQGTIIPANGNTIIMAKIQGY